MEQKFNRGQELNNQRMNNVTEQMMEDEAKRMARTSEIAMLIAALKEITFVSDSNTELLQNKLVKLLLMDTSKSTKSPISND